MNDARGLTCVLFPDLQPWERRVFEALFPALAARFPTSVHNAAGGWNQVLSTIRREKGRTVWLIARDWQQVGRRLAGKLGTEYQVYVSALDLQPKRVPLPQLFWNQLRPERSRFRILAHSAFAFRFLRELEAVQEARLGFLPLPCPEPSPASAASAKPVTVGALGTFSSDNNFNFLLSVAHYLRERRADLRFRLIGNGPLREHLAASIQELGLTGAVELVDSATDWNGMDLDLLLYCPLRNEHHVPLLYAASAGIPAICSEVYGIDELIQDQRDGFVLPVNEVKPTAELALRLIGDAALRRFFGGKLREKLIRDFAPERVADAYSAFFFPRPSPVTAPSAVVAA